MDYVEIEMHYRWWCPNCDAENGLSTVSEGDTVKCEKCGNEYRADRDAYFDDSTGF